MINSYVKSVKNKISTIPNYIVGNRFAFGFRLFLRNYFKLPIIIKTKNGAKLFLGLDPIDDRILRDLNGRLENVYFPPELDLKANEIVFDVGGHHGIFAVELAAKFPGVKIFSFEPDKTSINYFRFNNLLNRASKIKLIGTALDTISQIAFIIKSEEGSWGNYIESEAKEHASLIKTSSVVEILNQNAITDIKYAKFNAEGAEFKVIPELFRLHVFPEFILLFAHPEKGDVNKLINLIYDHSYFLVRGDDNDNRPWYFFKYSIGTTD